MISDKPVVRTLTSLEEVTRGMFIRISDGSKKPPAHHKKRLELWERHNTEAWVDGVSHGRVGLTKPHPDVNMSVRKVSHVLFKDLKIELLEE